MSDYIDDEIKTCPECGEIMFQVVTNDGNKIFVCANHVGLELSAQSECRYFETLDEREVKENIIIRDLPYKLDLNNKENSISLRNKYLLEYDKENIEEKRYIAIYFSDKIKEIFSKYNINFDDIFNIYILDLFFLRLLESNDYGLFNNYNKLREKALKIDNSIKSFTNKNIEIVIKEKSNVYLEYMILYKVNFFRINLHNNKDMMLLYQLKQYLLKGEIEKKYNLNFPDEVEEYLNWLMKS